MIAIFLVVLGHTFAFMQVDNQTYARHIVEERFMTRWLIGNPGDSTGGNNPHHHSSSLGLGCSRGVERCVLVGAGAFVSVDTFFFLSGFLAMLSQLEKYSITSAPVRPSQQQIYNTKLGPSVRRG